jgi:hypothetical protein
MTNELITTALANNAPDDELIVAIYTTAARAIVARERKLAARARVRWTPTLATELDNARRSREGFILGSRLDTADRREWRAALIADAQR